MKQELPYVHRYKDRHGKVRTYYRRDGVKRTIKGEIGSHEWMANYLEINESFENPTPKAPDHESLDYAITMYFGSPRYEKLKPASKDLYRKVLEPVRSSLGHRKVGSFSRGRLIQIRDTIAARSPSMAKTTIAILKLVFENAIDMDLIDRNPAKGVMPPPGMTTTPHRKWTDEEIALILDKGRPCVRRAMIVLLYTGLRCSDAVRLKLSDIKDGRIRLFTQKTGLPVVIPVHEKLKAELDRKLSLRVEPLFLMPNTLGGKSSVSGIYELMKADFARHGIQRTDAPTQHGLRKNAVAALVEAGCTTRQIQAITGQSLPMIEHYAQEYEREHLSDGAMILWEEHSKNR